MTRERYTTQVRLLVRALPLIAEESAFALKGGTVHPPVIGRIRPSVEEEFGFAEMATVTFEDLYAGKLVAALDRQHPRDLYDVKLLLDNEGISNELFRTFLVYVASSSRPPHELLAPPPN